MSAAQTFCAGSTVGSELVMREREIRYLMGTNTQARVIPVAEGVSDEDVAEIARRLTGLVYEREVTPWRHVLVGPSSTEEEKR